MDERDARGGHRAGESKKSAPAVPAGRLASGRAPPRDHPPPAPDAARGGGPVRARHGGAARRHGRARPRRALDRRRALRDPRRAAGPEGRRRGRHRRRDVRRAQRALAVRAPDVRPRARRRRARQAEGDRLRRRVHRAARTTSRPTTRSCSPAAAPATSCSAPPRWARRRARTIFGGKESQEFVKAHGRQRPAAGGRGGALRRLPYEIDGLKTLSVARSSAARASRSTASAPAARARGSTSPGRPATSATSRSRARSGAVPAGHVPRQDRGHRRDGAVAAGPPPDLVARRRDGRARRSTPTRSTRCCAACRCTTSGGLADLLIALGLTLLPLLLGLRLRPFSRSASGLAAARALRRRGAARVRAGADPAGGGAADRAGHRAGRARSPCTT